jgi:hypothetical protein
MLMELEAGEPGKMNIEDQQARIFLGIRSQEFLCGRERPATQRRRATKPPDGLPHGGVVIDDSYGWLVSDQDTKHDNPNRIGELSLGAE